MTELITPTPVSSVNHQSGDVRERTSLGVELASARKRLPSQPSIEVVAKQLNLSVHTIECLESDQFDELPPRLFVRGYIRAYAGLLGLPTEKILRRFDVLYPVKVEAPVAAPEFVSMRMKKPSARVRRRLKRRSKTRWGRRCFLFLALLTASFFVFRWVKSGATEAGLSTNTVSLNGSQAASSRPLVLRRNMPESD